MNKFGEEVNSKGLLVEMLRQSEKSVFNNDKNFLSKILHTALMEIHEADYGTISIIEDNDWNFIDAVGHNIDKLKKIPLKYEHILLNESNSDHVNIEGDDITIINNIINLDKNLPNMPRDIAVLLNEASKPIKQSMVIKIKFQEKMLGQIALDIKKGSSKTFSKDSVERIKPYKYMTAMFLKFYDTYSTVRKFENIMDLASQMLSSVEDDFEIFLKKLMNLAIEEIPESDYGSISIIEDKVWKFVDAVGHDIDGLKKLKLRMQHMLNQLRTNESIQELEKGVFYINGILEPPKNEEQLKIMQDMKKASKPIKETMQTFFSNDYSLSGMISLDIDKNSKDSFTKKSAKILKIIQDIGSIFLAHKETYNMMEKFEKLTDLVSNLVQAATNNDESFLSDLLKLAIDQIPEADYGSISIAEDGNWRYVDAVGHDISILKTLPLKTEYLIDANKVDKKNSNNTINMITIDNFDDYNELYIPENINRKLKKATLPIKTAMIAQYNMNGEKLGNISIEIDNNSLKEFSKKSKRLFKAVGNIAFSFMAFQKFTKMQKDSTDQIRRILDNAGQGFLTFKSNLLISSEYSKECREIFGRDIEDCDITKILYSSNNEDRNFLKKIYIDLLQNLKNDEIDIYMPLLPEEVNINDKYISIEHKLINNATERMMMIILTDITEKRNLEKKIKQETKKINMVIKAITNRQDLIEEIDDYKRFILNDLNEIITSEDLIEDKLSKLYRIIHTFKGNFSQFDFKHLKTKLHELENHLSYVIKGKMSLDELQKKYGREKYMYWLEQDIRVLEEYLGTQYLEDTDCIVIDKERITMIENKVKELLGEQEQRKVLPYIQKLKFKPFKDLLKMYPQYVQRLSERMGKPINKFEIEGKDIFVDHEYYKNFTKTLIHIFRNSLDHGIEEIDERIAKNKNEIGNIKCEYTIKDCNINLIIEDDGRGVDIESIKKKATLESSDFQEDDICKMIFKDGFTTNNRVTDISGRGVGLAAVRAELKKINGKVRVKTKKDKYCRFIFSLPLIS